jgi:hypothetical protein
MSDDRNGRIQGKSHIGRLRVQTGRMGGPLLPGGVVPFGRYGQRRGGGNFCPISGQD